MTDTASAEIGIIQDADGQRLRLTDAAVKRAQRVLATKNLDDLAERLGLSRQTFWRLRKGTTDIGLAKSIGIAQQIGWPINKVFAPKKDDLDSAADRG